MYDLVVEKTIKHVLGLVIDDFFMAWDMCCGDLGSYHLHVSSVCLFTYADGVYDTFAIREMLHLDDQRVRSALVGSTIRDVVVHGRQLRLILDTGWEIETRPDQYGKVIGGAEAWRLIHRDSDESFIVRSDGVYGSCAEPIKRWDDLIPRWATLAAWYGFPHLHAVKILWDDDDGTKTYWYTGTFLDAAHRWCCTLHGSYGSCFWDLVLTEAPLIAQTVELAELRADPDEIIDDLLDQHEEPVKFSMTLEYLSSSVLWKVETPGGIQRINALIPL